MSGTTSASDPIISIGKAASRKEHGKRWEFMFVGPALPITGTVGSPINPLAMF